MRILLTRPNSGIPVAPLPVGLMYLASAMREKGHTVRIYDGREREATREDYLREFNEFQPQLVGITAFTIEWSAFHALAALAKEWNPNTKVVAGGPHVSAYKQGVLKDANIDHALVGQAEITFPKLVAAYEAGEEPGEIGGLCWRENGERRYNAKWEIHDNLDQLPFPAYDLVDVDRYTNRTHGSTQNRLQVRKKAFPIFTSRGCPYACDFCHNIFGRKLYKRSMASVMHEIDYVVEKYGMQEMHISDDIFNMDLNHAKSILREIIARPYKLKIAFPNGLRADRVDDEFISLMKQAGTFRIMYAVETGSQEVQRRIKKNLRLEAALDTIRRTTAAGIHTGAFFMFGHADETREEMQQTVDFALKSDLNVASFFYATPFPDTDLHHKALERGVSEEYLESLYKEFMGVGYDVLSINLTKVPSEEIVRLKQEAVRRFYFSPKRIVSNLVRMPNPYVLWHNFVYVLKLAMMRKAYR